MSAHIKAMARAICEAKNKDPDEIVADGTAGKVRQWELYEPEEARAGLLALAKSIRKHGLPARALKEVSSWTRQQEHIADAIEAIATEGQ
jgi:hypothetical protein